MDLRPKFVFLMALAVSLAVLGADSGSPAFASELIVSPQTAVPNQRVLLTGQGFTVSAVPGGNGPSGSHQITGVGESVISVGGTPLSSPFAFYPVNFDSSGDWVSVISIPINDVTVAGGAITIKAVDDQGQMQTVQVIIDGPKITLDPATSRVNTNVTVIGKGFPSSNSLNRANSQVPIAYDGFPVKVVSVDDTGAFTTTVRVPSTTSIPSSNIVRASVLGFDRSAVAVHSVPDPSVTLSPTFGVPGTAVTVSGQGYPPGVLINNVRVGNINVSGSAAISTDADGSFVTFFSMPVFSPGLQNVFATAGNSTGGNVFSVSEGTPVLQPLPSPPPSIEPAEGLVALTQGENLRRVWTFNNGSKTWEFFDPRPAFAIANTIRTMVPGRIYWLQLNRNQSASINGKGVSLLGGWNLVPW